MTVLLPVSRFDLAMEALNVCQGYVNAGVKESGGNNQGQQVNVFQDANGGEHGESWCVDFQDTCDLKALANKIPVAYTAANFVQVCQGLHHTLSLYHVVTSSCGVLMADGKSRGFWIDRNSIKTIKKGWFVLYAWNPKDIGSRVPRHIGRCKQDCNVIIDRLISLEGNAGDGNQSDGDGCYEKQRNFANVVGVYATY